MVPLHNTRTLTMSKLKTVPGTIWSHHQSFKTAKEKCREDTPEQRGGKAGNTTMNKYVIENWEREKWWQARKRAEVNMLPLPGGTAGEDTTTSWSLCRFRLYPWTCHLDWGSPWLWVTMQAPRWGKIRHLDWTSSKDHRDPWYHQSPCWCLWSMLLPPRTMKSDIHVDNAVWAAAWGFGDVLCLCCIWGPCWCEWHG